VRLPVPYERFSFDTALSPHELARRLHLVTCAGEPRDASGESGCEFVGDIGEERFRVTRNIAYRNSFLPVIRGRIEGTATGALVRVSMRPHAIAMVFIAAWVAALTPVTVAILAHVVAHGFNPAVLVLVAFLGVSYALAAGSFTVESRRARKRLTEVLQAEDVPPAPAGYWPEGALVFRWADVRATGRLGFVWIGCCAVAGALALYDWLVRQAGCTQRQAHDPAYSCPTGVHVASIWGLLAATIVLALVGLQPVRRHRPQLLLPIILVQVGVIGGLAWVAHDPAFHVHLR
jgi:hypothetical protein